MAGASPETLVKLEDGVLHTFPLAGTRPRGKTDEEDKALEEELLADAEKNLSAMWAEGFTMKADELVVDNQKIEIAGMKITVIETPGHTLGGVCYYIEKEHVLFAGDTLFFESYGRTDFPGGSMFSLIRSLGKKLFVLPDETDVYPGHGQATSIGYEKTHNPAAGMR